MSVSGGAGAGGTIGSGIIFGYSEENGFQLGAYDMSGGGGFAGASASATLDLTIAPKATDINDMSGVTLTAGGSAGTGVVAGFEVNIPEAQKGEKAAKETSFTISGGIGIGEPAETHAFGIKTEVVDFKNTNRSSSSVSGGRSDSNGDLGQRGRHGGVTSSGSSDTGGIGGDRFIAPVE